MLVDMFGTPLAVGQNVFYADNSEDEFCPELSVYRIVELEEPNVIVGEALNGEVMGEWFYLENPVKRLAVIGSSGSMYHTAKCYSDSTIN